MDHTDNQLSIEKYKKVAENYDASARRTMPLRHRAIALLKLLPGQCVLDVGSGTGLSYKPLLRAVGTQGTLLAFEQSPEMFAIAQQRLHNIAHQDGNLGKVWLTCTAAEHVQLPQMADAVLFNYVHDIMRSREAIQNIMRQVKPGARIAVAGMKFFPWWTGPLNVFAWLKNQPYNARSADLWTPWDLVQTYCNAFQLEATQWGMGYVARGVKK